MSSSSSSICQNLHCRTPNRSGYYFAGPALQGTDCGNNLVSALFISIKMKIESFPFKSGVKVENVFAKGNSKK